MRDSCGILKKHITLEIKRPDWVPTFSTYYLCDTEQAIQAHLICKMKEEDLSTYFAGLYEHQMKVVANIYWVPIMYQKLCQEEKMQGCSDTRSLCPQEDSYCRKEATSYKSLKTCKLVLSSNISGSRIS